MPAAREAAIEEARVDPSSAGLASDAAHHQEIFRRGQAPSDERPSANAPTLRPEPISSPAVATVTVVALIIVTLILYLVFWSVAVHIRLTDCFVIRSHIPNPPGYYRNAAFVLESRGNLKAGDMIDDAKAPYAALLLRVSMGILFIMHGIYLKAIVFGMAGASGYFSSLGLPGWFAWFVMLYETVGGIALILGLFTRWVAIFLGIHLLAAAFFGHASNGWMFNAQGGGWEYPVFWAIACFALALMGSGAHSMKIGQTTA